MESLVLAGFGELMDPDNGVWLTSETDPGEGKPDVASVSRLLTDGDVQSGLRTGNRQWTLPIIVEGAPATVAATVSTLHTAMDKASFSLIWTPNGLPSVVSDCYRHTDLVEQTLVTSDSYLCKLLTYTVPALPFTRSPTPVIASSFVASSQIASLDSLTGWSTSPTASVDTTTFVEGTGSLRFPVTFTNAIRPGTWYASATLARTFSAIDFSSVEVVGVKWLTNVLGLVAAAPLVSPLAGASLTLYSAGGRQSTWLNKGSAPTPAWSVLAFDLTQPADDTNGGVGVDTHNVTSLTLVAAAGAYSNTYIPPQSYIWLDDIENYPAGSGVVIGGSANLYFPAVQGAARAPISVQVTDTTNTIQGVIIANTPNPPPGYNPVLTYIGGTATLSWTRKATSLQRADPTEPGTYRLMLLVDSAKVVGTVTVTATQTAPQGPVSTSVQRTVASTDADMAVAILRGTKNYALVSLPALALPVDAVDAQNTSASVTIAVSGGASMAAGDILGAWLIWTGAEVSFTMQGVSGGGYYTVYLDEPNPQQQLGSLLVSVSKDNGRAGASAPEYRRGNAVINFTPGPNHLLVAALPPGGTAVPSPSITVSYYPRYLTERAA